MSGAIGDFVIGGSAIGGTTTIGLTSTPATPIPCDFYLEWNSDFVLTPTGSIQTAVNWDRVRERIIRRFLTNSAQKLPDGSTTPPDYVFDPTFGIGAGALVDQTPTEAWITALTGRLRQSILIDAAVDPGAVPTVTVTNDGHTIQVLATVQLINGQPGQIAISID